MADNVQTQAVGTAPTSYLMKGNAALRAGHYEEALNLFHKAQTQTPALAKTIAFNIALASARLQGISLSALAAAQDQVNTSLTLPTPKRKLPITAVIITWDIGHNPLGRSYMLAEALDRVVQNTVLTGFQFDRYGKSIWEPVKDATIPIVPLKGTLFPELLTQFNKIIEKFKPDIVFACKPRLPSIQLGAMFKNRYGIPLVVDIDDHELSFIKNRDELNVDALLKLDKEYLRTQIEPYSEIWTRLANDLVKYADATIVSNTAIQREFGGHILPHVRDENLFNPSLYDKNKLRKKYGIPENSKVVMFFGTPRHHKGIGVLAHAIGEIRDSNFILVIIGTAPDKNVTKKLEELTRGKLINLPNQSFSAIPEIVIMADVICLPQDELHETSKYQLPAKAIDAVAMGIPLLVSNTEPLMQLVNDNVAELVDINNLSAALERSVNTIRSQTDTNNRRQQFLKKYSYAAAETQLRAIIEPLISKKTSLKPCKDLKKLTEFQINIFDIYHQPKSLNGKDIIIFWKQNDTGLYGRRHDMVIKYLASRNDVRKVIVIDTPISEFDLIKKRNGNALTQDRSVYVKTYEKLFGQLDTEKISYNVFTHKPGIYTYKDAEKNRKPIFEGYCEYLKDVFHRESINTDNAIFWFYPKNYLSSDIIKYFNPGKVVVDVVDDHRAWPGTSEEEIEKLTSHYQDILSQSDLSMANCQPVMNSMKQFSPKIQLVPNSCEDDPEIIEPISNPFFQELKEFKGNVIGFVGNLEAKIDIILIQKLASRFSDSLVVLVGSTHANPAARELIKIPNIRMFGVIDYKYINAIAEKFTVGIVPHKKMALTENMNPLKVFMYLSNRIPVICTDVSNIPPCNAIFTTSSHEEFIEKCELILSKRIIASGFDEFIQENSWKTRLKPIVDQLYHNQRTEYDH